MWGPYEVHMRSISILHEAHMTSISNPSQIHANFMLVLICRQHLSGVSLPSNAAVAGPSSKTIVAPTAPAGGKKRKAPRQELGAGAAGRVGWLF